MTSPRRRPSLWRVLALSVLLLSALATACGSDESGGGTNSAVDGEELRPFTVVLDWTPNTNHSGVYLAKANGWYRAAGLDVKVIEPGDAGALQLLAAGRADVAFSAQETLIPARSEGVPAVAIAAVIQHNTSSLLSLTKTGITGPEDLPGHTYGGFGGPLEQALVERLVTCAGGDPSSVKFAEVGEVDYRVGLDQGQYDFVWIFDAWDKIRLAELEGVEVDTIPFIDHSDCIPDWYTPMMITSEEVIADRDGDLMAFMAATKRGYQTAMADPTAAADALLEAVPELDPALVRPSAEYLSTRYAEDPAAWGLQTDEIWRGFVDFLVEAGLITESIDVESAFTNRFLEP